MHVEHQYAAVADSAVSVTLVLAVTLGQMCKNKSCPLSNEKDDELPSCRRKPLTRTSLSCLGVPGNSWGSTSYVVNAECNGRLEVPGIPVFNSLGWYYRPLPCAMSLYQSVESGLCTHEVVVDA